MSRRWELQDLTLSTGDSLAEAMRKIDRAASGVIFVVSQGVVLGSVSDGDIRRAVLAGHGLEERVDDFMNQRFVSAHESDPPSVISRLFQAGVNVIPLLDSERRVVRFISREESRGLVPVSEPDIGHLEIEMALRCLQSGWISSSGPNVRQFEEVFGSFIGVASCVSTSSGTSALELALRALNVGPGDEVIVPDLTFAATANAVMAVGARPVLVDVQSRSWCLGLEQVRPAVSSQTRAIIAVHLYGYPAEVDVLRSFCNSNDLLLIEDCAEAIGTYLGESHVGTFGHAGTFSFYGNKTITTGEGGMVCFENESVAARACTIKSHGMSSRLRYWHDSWGTNWRLTSLQASIGIAQVMRLPEFLAAKQQNASHYNYSLGELSVDGLELPSSASAGVHSYWLYSVLLPPDLSVDLVGGRLLANGIETRRIFHPLHIQPAFASARQVGDFQTANDVFTRGLSLPSSVKLTPQDRSYVVDNLSIAIEGRDGN